MKKLLIFGIIAVLLASIGVVMAKSVVAPPKFVSYKPPESQLTKTVFIRYAPGREPATCGNGVCEPREKKTCPSDCTNNGEEPPETTCFGFLVGSKPRLNWLEDYYYGDSSLLGPSSLAVSIWEYPVLDDIFGDGIQGTYSWGSYDYVNSISFGDYDDTGMCPTADPCVIAVTAIWSRGKNIYEYDIMFDTDFFPGGKEVAYDLETVTLHEFGHAAGLYDIYDETCSNNVMYGYYTIPKTTLGSGDITGITTLYGESP